MKKKYLLLVVILLGAVTLVGCHQPPAEQQIRTAIQKAETAARQQNSSGIMAIVSDQFQGNNGQILDHDDLGHLVSFALFTNKTLIVTTGPLHFQKQSGSIAVDFTLSLAGIQGWLPDGQTLEMNTVWKSDHGKWLCVAATWTQPQNGYW